MAFLSNDKLWRSEFCKIDSPNYSVQDINFNQLKLNVNDTYK